MGDRLTAWALDLDGVIWRGSADVPGAAEAVARLRERGEAVAFVTNSAYRTPDQVAEKLASHGVPDARPEVITAAMAAAAMVEPGERVLTIGSTGLTEAITERGALSVDTGPVDVVAVGISFEFDYDALTQAMNAIGEGARFIATNTDPTYPVAEGLLPGNGALVAAVATASGVEPEVAGKPHEPIATLVRELLGPAGIMVGDRPDTDGRFARSLGYEFGLVFSGVTSPSDLPVSPEPDHQAGDLLALVRRHQAAAD